MESFNSQSVSYSIDDGRAAASNASTALATERPLASSLAEAELSCVSSKLVVCGDSKVKLERVKIKWVCKQHFNYCKVISVE